MSRPSREDWNHQNQRNDEEETSNRKLRAEIFWQKTRAPDGLAAPDGPAENAPDGLVAAFFLQLTNSRRTSAKTSKFLDFLANLAKSG